MKRLLVALAAMAVMFVMNVSAASAYNYKPPQSGPPSANFGAHEFGVWVVHCQAYNEGAGVIVFTPAAPPPDPNGVGDVMDNCRG